MPYEGGELRPLFNPGLAEQASRKMATDGRDKTMSFAVEATPINENPFSSPGRKPGTARGRWRHSGPIMRHSMRGYPAYTGKYENWDPIAPFIENDTRPHDIRPRADRSAASVIVTKKPRRLGDDPQAALTWLTIGGRRVFARVVKHPGTTGHHMTLKASARAELEMGVICQPSLDWWAKRAVREANKINSQHRISGGHWE